MSLINRAFSVGFTLESVTGLVEGQAADKLRLAVKDLDGLITDALVNTFERYAAPRLDDEGTRTDSVAFAAAALAEAERALNTAWAGTFRDLDDDPDRRDYLAQSTRLAHRARRALQSCDTLEPGLRTSRPANDNPLRRAIR